MSRSKTRMRFGGRSGFRPTIYMPVKKIFTRIGQSVRWRLGMPVAAAELEEGTDESVAAFYNNRVTDCAFLDSPDHYEFPRAKWVLEHAPAQNLLEIGCGNGGMTRLLAPLVEELTAFDVSAPSLREVEAMGLPNVKTIQGLIENLRPEKTFERIVISEVIEHLRDPGSAIRTAFEWLSPGGSMLITTPNGHWESDEHLHEFSLQTFSALFTDIGCEKFEAAYLRDRDDRHRWLTAQVWRAERPAKPNDFFDRKATKNIRRNPSG